MKTGDSTTVRRSKPLSSKGELRWREAKRLIDSAATEPDLSRRIDKFSSLLLGRPYAEKPLDGGPGRKEALTISLDRFDCVTYMETVLGLALSKSPDEMEAVIRALRYADGRVDWASRNHYMVDWLHNNSGQGLVKNNTTGKGTVSRERALDVVPGIPRRSVTVRCFPKRAIRRVSRRIATGDLIFFVSTRQNLDVFHTGILAVTPNVVLMRHATRSAGAVIEQPLTEFLELHRMTGFILLRPTDRAPA
jgi:hypothetical protein